MCYLCPQTAKSRATDKLCRSVGTDRQRDEQGRPTIEAFVQPDRTQRPPSLAAQKRAMFAHAAGWPCLPFGRVVRDNVTLDLFRKGC